jgi:CheY-like chemotaxis protein
MLVSVVLKLRRRAGMPSQNAAVNLRSDPQLGSAVSGDSLRVLVIDDTLDYSTALAGLLGSWGYSVEVARSGREALKVVEEFQPRIILLDLGLPDVHGYELAKQLRAKLPNDHRVKFIVITGWMQIADQLASTAARISHHLVKPVNLTLLREILAAYRDSESDFLASQRS